MARSSKASVQNAAKGVLSYFTRHRTAANLLLVVLLTLGAAATPNMRAQFFPDVVIDNVSVSVRWDGAGAEDVDRAIAQILEPALLGVEGVESSSSRSQEGSTRISLDFEDGWDMARAADEVQSAVDGVGNLPEDAEDPVVRRGAWRDRVTDVVITGPIDVAQLGGLADEFVTRLFAEGVTRSTVRGVVAPETVVEVSSLALIEHDISMAEIAAAIAAEAEADPAGDVDAVNTRVRTGVAKRSADEIANIVLRYNGNSQLLVGDVANVIVHGTDRNRAYFVGDNPAISIRIDRSARGDAIGIQASVQSVADEMSLTLPQGTKVDLIRTRAAAITGRLDLLLDNGLIGLALVVGLLFLFLNARTAIWVAAGIPVAMFTAIALMYAAGLTINMISLFALIITLGIVVDDAIVVGEHADFRARTLGEPPMIAAENAARRMAPPVFSATVTTVIAFFGLTAISGRFGSLIADIPFTVIAVLIASLVECFLILPNHMAHALKHSAKTHWYDLPSRIVNRGFDWVRDTLFRPMIRFVILARYPVMALAVALLASQVALFGAGDVNWRFFNAPERASVSGNFAMANGATRADTRAMMQEMQRAAAAVAARYEAEHDVDIIDYVMAEIGGNTGRGLSGVDTKDSSLLGSIAIELIDPDLRVGYSSFAFVADVQEEVRQHPMAEVVSFRGWRQGPGGDALDVEFYGAEATVLKAAAEALKTEVSKFPEVSAVEDSLAYDKEELILDLTAQGQALGFTIDDLGRVLRDRLNGIEAATYPDGPRSATIRVELPEGELSADFLERSYLRAASGTYVPLADIVSVARQTGFSTVRRENGLRVVSVSGDISEDDPVQAEAIMTALRDDILPRIQSDHGIGYRLAGLAEQENEFLSDALLGLMMALIGIFLTLAWAFSSWTRPLVVMAIIPFGLVGTIWGHYIWEVPLSMFSVVGLIGMTGIIINDSIVLITTIDDYARERGLVPAIIDGVADRLRPVLLTTLTTVLGLAPLLYESSSQAQFLKPTVITLVYGLGFGMGLVLLVVPALVAMQSDVAKHFIALRRALRLRSAAWPVNLGVAAASLIMVGLFATTIGAAISGGKLPSVLGEDSLAMPQAVLGFLALSLATVVIIYLVLIAGVAILRRRV